MHRPLKKLTAGVARNGQQLVAKYRPKKLHAFRIGIRRIRSILKQIGSHRSRRFRKTWGGLNAITNDARDWDVFFITARKLLSPEDFSEFKRLNQGLVQSSHEAVVAMLQSMLWQRHIEEWQAYIQRAADYPSGQELSLLSLDQALGKARLMLSQALTVDDERSWHKFRIAVKDVRYVADASTVSEDEAPYLEAVTKDCKLLQAALGNWHDASIQMHMLEDLEPAAVHVTLGADLEQRKQQFLSQTREILADSNVFTLEQ
jgi:CHAD domain-containing protein